MYDSESLSVESRTTCLEFKSCSSQRVANVESVDAERLAHRTVIDVTSFIVIGIINIIDDNDDNNNDDNNNNIIIIISIIIIIIIIIRERFFTPYP